MLNDLMDLIRRNRADGVNPAFGVNPADGINPGFAPAPLLTQRPDNFIPGLGGDPRGAYKSSQNAGVAGRALPPPAADQPLPGAMTVPQAAGSPFTPRDVDVSLFGRGDTRHVTSREEELSALAEKVGRQASANALGTGYMPDGSILDPRLGMQASNAASNDFLRTAMSGDDNAARERMGLAQIAGQKDIAGITTKGRLDEQSLQNQGLIEATRIKGDHEHAASLNKATLDAIGAMNGGGLDPANFKTVMDLINGQRQNRAGAAGPPLSARDSGDKGAAMPAAPGAAPGAAPPTADPLAAAQDMAKRNQILARFQGDFDPKVGVTPESATKLVDRLQSERLSPEERSFLVDQMRAGKLGDPAKLQDSLYQVAAKNYLLKQGITGGVNPQEMSRTDMAVPFGDSKDPLMTIRREPGSNVPERMAKWVGGGFTAQPFNQVVLPGGRTLPLDAPLNIMGLNNHLGLNAADTRAAHGRTYHSAQLIADLIRASKGK